MTVVGRDAWGARPPTSRTSMPANPLGVAVHYEGVNLGEYAHETCAARVRTIQALHIDRNRWSDVAYNYLVCRHGYVFEGRGARLQPAANGTSTANQRHYAVCVLMGPADRLTEEAKAGVHEALSILRSAGAGSRVTCHSDHIATACPGAALGEWVRAGLPITSPVPALPADDDLISRACATAKGRVGYYVLSSDGGVYACGGAPFYGSMGGQFPEGYMVDILVTPSGEGYALIGRDGGVFCFGDAHFYGSYPGLPPEGRMGERYFVGGYYDDTDSYTLVSNRLEQTYHFKAAR